jgi:multidrug efflux pump subunit AcrA (membrane-fusion protein)
MMTFRNSAARILFATAWLTVSILPIGLALSADPAPTAERSLRDSNTPHGKSVGGLSASDPPARLAGTEASGPASGQAGSGSGQSRSRDDRAGGDERTTEIESAAGGGSTQETRAGEQVLVPGCSVKFFEQALLACDRPGVVAKVNCREGDFVAADSPLVQLRDDVPRAQLATYVLQSEGPDADVKVRNKQKAEEFARQRYEIALDALKKNRDAVSRAEVLELRTMAERAILDTKEAQFELDVARRKRDEAQAELGSYRVLSTFGGFVSRVLKQPGEAVQQGTAVVEMVNPKQLKVEGFVARDVVARLVPGQRCVVRRTAAPSSGASDPAFDAGGIDGNEPDPNDVDTSAKRLGPSRSLGPSADRPSDVSGRNANEMEHSSRTNVTVAGWQSAGTQRADLASQPRSGEAGGSEMAGGFESSGKLVFVDVGLQPVNQRVRVWALVDNESLMLRAGDEVTLVIDCARDPEASPAE